MNKNKSLMNSETEEKINTNTRNSTLDRRSLDTWRLLIRKNWLNRNHLIIQIIPIKNDSNKKTQDKYRQQPKFLTQECGSSPNK